MGSRKSLHRGEGGRQAKEAFHIQRDQDLGTQGGMGMGHPEADSRQGLQHWFKCWLEVTAAASGGGKD